MQLSEFNDWLDWGNFRKKRFWAIVLIVTYTFAGFFLAPLPLIHRYFKDELRFNVDNCCLDVALNYTVAALEDGNIEAGEIPTEALETPGGENSAPAAS